MKEDGKGCLQPEGTPTLGGRHLKARDWYYKGRKKQGVVWKER